MHLPSLRPYLKETKAREKPSVLSELERFLSFRLLPSELSELLLPVLIPCLFFLILPSCFCCSETCVCLMMYMGMGVTPL